MSVESSALLIGYYGQRNTGDDAFLVVTAWGVSRFLGGRRILAAASQVPHTYNVRIRPVLSDLRVIRRRNQMRLQAAAQASQIIVFGGGSLFHEGDQIEDWRRLLDLAGAGRHLALGVSFGPFIDTKAEKACARLIGKLDFISVRDRASIDIVRDLVPSANVALTFDLAPLLPMATGMELLTQSVSCRDGIGLALRDYDRFIGRDPATDRTRARIIAAALSLCAERGIFENLTIFDFNGHSVYGDFEIHRYVTTLLSPRIRVKHIPYSPDPAIAFQALNSVRGMIAMRMHAAVFAFCTRTPTLILSYQPKCIGWANMIGCPAEFIHDAHSLDVEELAHSIERLVSPSPAQPKLSVAEALRCAELSWRLAQ